MKQNKWVVLLLICGLFSWRCNQGPDRAFVISKIKKASKLATVEFVLTKTLIARKDKRLLFLLKLNTASFMAYTEARVKAGIDLSKLIEEDIKIEGNKINLTLPPIEILNFSYPAESFVEDTLYTDPDKFLNNISVEDQEEIFRRGETDIRNNLQYLGIERTAQEKTRMMISSMLSQLGFEEMYIQFKPSEGLVPTIDPDLVEE